MIHRQVLLQRIVVKERDFNISVACSTVCHSPSQYAFCLLSGIYVWECNLMSGNTWRFGFL